MVGRVGLVGMTAFAVLATGCIVSGSPNANTDPVPVATDIINEDAYALDDVAGTGLDRNRQLTSNVTTYVLVARIQDAAEYGEWYTRESAAQESCSLDQQCIGYYEQEGTGFRKIRSFSGSTRVSLSNGMDMIKRKLSGEARYTDNEYIQQVQAVEEGMPICNEANAQAACDSSCDCKGYMLLNNECCTLLVEGSQTIRSDGNEIVIMKRKVWVVEEKNCDALSQECPESMPLNKGAGVRCPCDDGEFVCTAAACCSSATCPAYSYGVSIHDGGCTCYAGFNGSISATLSPPYYSGECQAVLCPDDSNGVNVPDAYGCTCNDGYLGEVTPLSSPPYYSSTCTKDKWEAFIHVNSRQYKCEVPARDFRDGTCCTHVYYSENLREWLTTGLGINCGRTRIELDEFYFGPGCVSEIASNGPSCSGWPDRSGGSVACRPSGGGQGLSKDDTITVYSEDGIVENPCPHLNVDSALRLPAISFRAILFAFVCKQWW